MYQVPRSCSWLQSLHGAAVVLRDTRAPSRHSSFQRRVFGAVDSKFRFRFIGRCHSGAADDVAATDTAL